MNNNIEEFYQHNNGLYEQTKADEKKLNLLIIF